MAPKVQIREISNGTGFRLKHQALLVILEDTAAAGH
jgi:hypothetical protein